MNILPLVTSKVKTLQAASTVSAATNASPIAITTSAAHGLQTGDVVVITGALVNTAANGKFAVTVVDTTHFTLNGSAGNGVYTSGGSVAHVGFQVSPVTVDNTVIAQSNPDYTLKFQVASLSAATGFRMLAEDSDDSGATWYPGLSWSRFGALAPAGDAIGSGKREDYQGVALGNSGDQIRLVVLLEGALGAAPPAGASITFSSWLEY